MNDSVAVDGDALEVVSSFRYLDLNRSLRRVFGAPTFASSQITAERCNQLLLHHHPAFVQAKYCKRLLSCHHPLVKFNMPYIKERFFHVACLEMF